MRVYGTADRSFDPRKGPYRGAYMVEAGTLILEVFRQRFPKSGGAPMKCHRFYFCGTRVRDEKHMVNKFPENSKFSEFSEISTRNSHKNSELEN